MEEKLSIDKAFNVFTQTDEILRNGLFRFASKLTDHQRAKIFAKALKKKYDHRSDSFAQYGLAFVIYGEFVKELKLIKNIISGQIRQGTPAVIRALEEDRERIITRVSQKRKKRATKRSQLEKIIPELVELRRSELSFETIRDYVQEKYKLKVSRETLRKMILKHIHSVVEN